MPNFQVISRERHAGQRWKRYTNYAFAAADTVAPLVLTELPKAAMSLPIAFIAQGDAYVPAAVLGVQPGCNLFVSPDRRWLGQYVPSFYRSSPFRLLNAEEGLQVLCIDEEIGLATGAGATSEAFFNPDGQPAQALKDIFNFLSEVEKNRQLTVSICAALHKHQLIRPWTIKIKIDGGEQQVAGLFQIDEAALNQLPAEAFLEIRRAGALPVAYCQLLSMQHLPILSQLFDEQAGARKQMDQQVGLSEEMKHSFYNSNETISFASLDG